MKRTAGRMASGNREYQLQIALRGIRPPVWRRVLVPGTLLLSGLHGVIQTVFGWTDSHLHQFYVGTSGYGKPLDFDQDVRDEAFGEDGSRGETDWAYAGQEAWLPELESNGVARQQSWKKALRSLSVDVL